MTRHMSNLQLSLLRLTRIHFVIAAIFALYTIISDATNLATPALVLQRWSVGVLLLSVTAVLWYAARGVPANPAYYRALLLLLVLIDICIATFSVYTQRGMASRGVMLYAVPIAVSAVLLSRRALFATAALCVASYVLAATRYFVVNPGEGYKAELYNEVGFYSAIFFVLAATLWVLIREKSGK